MFNSLREPSNPVITTYVGVFLDDVSLLYFAMFIGWETSKPIKTSFRGRSKWLRATRKVPKTWALTPSTFSTSLQTFCIFEFSLDLCSQVVILIAVLFQTWQWVTTFVLILHEFSNLKLLLDVKIVVSVSFWSISLNFGCLTQIHWSADHRWDI